MQSPEPSQREADRSASDGGGCVGGSTPRHSPPHTPPADGAPARPAEGKPDSGNTPTAGGEGRRWSGSDQALPGVLQRNSRAASSSAEKLPLPLSDAPSALLSPRCGEQPTNGSALPDGVAQLQPPRPRSFASRGSWSAMAAAECVTSPWERETTAAGGGKLAVTQDLMASYDLLQDTDEGGNDLTTAGGFDVGALRRKNLLEQQHARFMRCADAPLIGRSFFLFRNDSSFRVMARDLVCDWRWRTVLAVVAWLSTLTLYIWPRNVQGESTTDAQLGWIITDACIIFFYAVDILLCCVAWGAFLKADVFGQGTRRATRRSAIEADIEAVTGVSLSDADQGNYTYLGGSTQHRMDTFIILLAVALQPVGIYGVHALRVMRYLPHQLYPQARSVRALFESFTRSSSLLIDNISILTFFILFFGICAVEFFAAGFAWQCVLTNPNATIGNLNNNEWAADDWKISDEYTALTCSNESHSLFGPQPCPSSDSALVECVDVGNEDPNWLHYDNLGSAVLVIFQVIQLENWSGLMFPLFRSRNTFFVYAFFVIMIVTCRFIIINLFFAIIVLYFDQTRKNLDQNDPDADDQVARYGETLSNVCRALMGCCPEGRRQALMDRWGPLLRRTAEEEAVEEEARGAERSPGSPISPWSSPTGAGAAVSSISAGDELVRPLRDPSTNSNENAGEREPRAAAAEGSESSEERRADAAARYWRFFNAFIYFVILANVAVQSTEHAGQSESHARFLDISEYCFLSIYAVEQIARAVFRPIDFRTNVSHWYDLFLVVMAIPPAAGVSSLSFFTRMRTFRLLMAPDRLREFVQRINWEPILSVLYMIITMMLLFAAIGMQLFAGMYKKDGQTGAWMDEDWQSRFNFDTVGKAVLTLFLVMAGDNWSLPMYQGMEADGMFVPAMCFYLTFFVLSNWVLLSMFIAVLLDEFEEVVGGSLLEKSIENHELIARSKELFSQFLRKVDMNDAADDVDEENVAGMCAVVNIHKWAARAKEATDKKMRYKAKKTHLGTREIEQSANIMQGLRLANTLGGMRRRLAENARAAGPVPKKGVNAFLHRSKELRQRKADHTRHLADSAQRALIANVRRERGHIQSRLDEGDDLTEKDRKMLQQLLRGRVQPSAARAKQIFTVPKRANPDDTDFSSDADSDPPDSTDMQVVRASFRHSLRLQKGQRLPGIAVSAVKASAATPPSGAAGMGASLRGVIAAAASANRDDSDGPPAPADPAAPAAPSEECGAAPAAPAAGGASNGEASRYAQGIGAGDVLARMGQAPPPQREDSGEEDEAGEDDCQEMDEDGAACELAETGGDPLQTVLEALGPQRLKTVRRKALPLKKRLKGRSLFIFPEDHPVREFCVRVAEMKSFSRGVLFTVVVSSVLLIFSPPAGAWGDPSDAELRSMDMYDDTIATLPASAEQAFDIIFLAVFTVEFIVKVVAFGFIWMAYKSRGIAKVKQHSPYIRDAWNVLDFCILAVMYVQFIMKHAQGNAGGFGTVRVFRVLRVIRVLRRVESLRLILSALLARETLTSTLLVLLLALFFYVSFALIAVNVLGGELSSCTDPSRAWLYGPGGCLEGSAFTDVALVEVDARPTYASPEVYSWDIAPPADLAHIPEEPGYLVPRAWVAPQRNYDEMGEAIIALTTIASGEEWATPMIIAVDRKGWGIAAFFIVYMVLMSFVVINMVIFVITNAIRSHSGTSGMEPEQIEWSDLQHHIRGLSPLPWIPLPETNEEGQLTTKGRVRRALLRIAGPKYMKPNPWFDNFVNIVIVVNIALMATEYRNDQMRQLHTDFITNANYVIVSIYIMEFIIRIVALSPAAYFRDKWNCFDFVIVLGSMVSIGSVVASGSTGSGSTKVGSTAKLFSIIRIFRILRLFKLIRRFKGVAFLFGSLLSSIPAIMNIMLIVVLFIWVWGAIGTELFGQVRFQSSLNTNVSFRSFFHAFTTLTMVITLDDWINIFHESQLSSPECSTRPPPWVGEADGGPQGVNLATIQDFNDCGRPGLAAAYFISFFILGGYIFINLVTAAILDEVQHTISREQCRVTEIELEEYQLVWMHVVQGNATEMPRWRLPHLLEGLFFRNKLGMHPTYHKKLFTTSVLKLDWHKLHNTIRKGRLRRQTLTHAFDEAHADALARTGSLSTVAQHIWPPPMWSSFRFREVLRMLCHNSYANVPLTIEDVALDEIFQKKADRLLATQVLQSVVRMLTDIHLIERDKHPGIRREGEFTQEDKRKLKAVRFRIRGWKSEIREKKDGHKNVLSGLVRPPPSAEMLARLRAPPYPVPDRIIFQSMQPGGKFRLYRLPEKMRKVTDDDHGREPEHEARRRSVI
eukprot:TRINITY_DN49944_c0_g1_i1.p1 TRINITY_DN49944_c0_g1~~TRINITY_DN49944_c0_g1_i1.p1  ORF type:complete len:2322 (+),score=868.18 TRINITY_DN49944_c0_g1_i1:215-7180(+)